MVFDDDESAVAAGELGDGDGAVGRREDRGTVRGSEIEAGMEPFGVAGDRVHPRPEVAGLHPGALRQREHHPRRPCRRRRVEHRNGTTPTAAAEGVEDGGRDGRVVVVPVGIVGHFDGLRGFTVAELFPAGDVEQSPRGRVVRAVRAAEERPRLELRVHKLFDGAPPGLRPHLEQTQAVMIAAVAVVGVVAGFGVGAGVRELLQRGFGQCGHECDVQAVPVHPVDSGADLDDRRGVGELFLVQRERLPVAGGHRQ